MRWSVAAPCTFNTSYSATTDVGLGSPPVFQQHFTLYNDRYIAGSGSDRVYAYVNWQTDVWWTRTGLICCGTMFAKQATDVTEFGVYAGTLRGTYNYPKQ